MSCLAGTTRQINCSIIANIQVPANPFHFCITADQGIAENNFMQMRIRTDDRIF